MIKQFAKKYNAWRSYKRTFNELYNLSNAELDDIGVARADISSIARGTYQRSI